MCFAQFSNTLRVSRAILSSSTVYPLGKQALEASKGIGLEPKEEVDEDCWWVGPDVQWPWW